MARVLILDDDMLFCELLESVMAMNKHESVTAFSIAQGKQELENGVFDVVFLDVGLPDGNGVSLIPSIRARADGPDVVMITGDGDPDGAELAMLNGALDYIQKPASITVIADAVERALTFRKSRISDAPLADRQGIVGSSGVMEACIRHMSEAASSDISVLISGETGTGKELFARAIHRNSSRRDGPFVIVDCATISESLIESELFGHERGAFTGAERARDGLIKQAHGGTLFLDEVGELPMAQQKTFLRVLQEHYFRPVGAKNEQFCDFRVVAASNRDLWELVERNAFRKDLLFRLQALRLDLPPLRERSDDISELATFFLARRCHKEGYPLKEVTCEYREELMEYLWPGNVRELLNAVERSFVVGRSSAMLMAEHLPAAIRAAVVRTRFVRSASDEISSSNTSSPFSESDSDVSFASSKVSKEGVVSWREYREQAMMKTEREYLVALLASADGNVTRASEMAGVTRQRLYTMLKKHGMTRSWASPSVMVECKT